jgi:D-3-phosphoglycerate dehydrogenase
MSSAVKILIIDTCHDILPEKLRQAGFLTDIQTTITQEDLYQKIGDFHGLIMRSKYPADKTLLGYAKNLQFIGRIGAGMDNIDLEECNKRNIICLNSPEGNRNAVAEHAMGMLLSMTNNLLKADQQVRQGLWLREENRGMEIAGKTMGIIGFGNMGSAFAHKLQSFDVRILAYDKYKTGFGTEYVLESTMDQLFEECDMVSLHIPLTSETQYLANNLFFNRFKKNILFINTSRGKVVHTSDLVSAIKSGKVSGAALDVLEYEGTSFESLDITENPDLEYLLKSDKSILSPHIAGWTIESNRKLSEVLAQKIIELFAY